MAEPTDMIMPMLREMRSDAEQRHLEVIQRLDKLEQAQVSFRHALTADSLLGRMVTGEFEERIEALEAKMKKLEV
ncbi:MAG: hypothetical protein IOC90_01995 [Methylocystis sp.]|nr:hypothetical protein [Methylocystis sp.]MCA3584130.1 hypothetical protein [Methylocystis sp.]MCA3586797.1 hypothetical protein [Methylocystis sp.]MCA3591250.1 hypothetical protein [Methylocystis sp.]